MIDSTIKVTMKTVYGKVLIYPVDDNAKLFAALIELKTFTKQHIEIIKRLGFKVELVNGYSLPENGV